MLLILSEHMLRRIQRLKSLRWFARSFFSIRMRRSPNRKAASLLRQLSLGLRGFYPERHAFYELDKNDRRLYVSDLQMARSSFINRQYRPMLDNKVLFEVIVGRYAEVPASLVLVRNGQPFWLGALPEESRTLPELIRKQRAVMAKPVIGNGGRGVQLLEFKDGGFQRNGVQIDESKLSWSLLGACDTLVSVYVRQGSFANGLYPKSVNTIRVLTMLDPDTQSPFIADAVIRVGCNKSAPVDNVSSGGFVCNIEPDSGRLSNAVAGFYLDGPVRRIECHPDTGMVFADQVIPDWESIREQVVILAAKFPMLPYIAWDLAILDEGISIIEANSWSELGSIQMGKPLLADPRVRKFFEHHKVL
jgi:hypothetical protein